MKQDIKQKIIETTLKLIRETKGRPEDITVRDICNEAGIGVSQINYHFQTKENLIAQCVQLLIGDVILAYPGDEVAFAGVPVSDALKTRLVNILNYLYANENISRISILTDHQDPKPGDNTFQTEETLVPLVAKLCAQQGVKEDPRVLTSWLVLTLQGLFLRTDVVKGELGLDLRNESDRKKLVEGYVNTVFHVD